MFKRRAGRTSERLPATTAELQQLESIAERFHGAVCTAVASQVRLYNGMFASVYDNEARLTTPQDKFACNVEVSTYQLNGVWWISRTGKRPGTLGDGFAPGTKTITVDSWPVSDTLRPTSATFSSIPEGGEVTIPEIREASETLRSEVAQGLSTHLAAMFAMQTQVSA